MMKLCRPCGVEHPVQEFHRDKYSKDGLKSYCKRVNHHYFVEWKKRNDPFYPRKKGDRRKPARDGDQRQARRRVQTLIENGTLPHPNDIPCVDCGNIYNGEKRGHEYDHHKGYAAEHHEDVECVCYPCHKGRERERERANAEHTKPF